MGALLPAPKEFGQFNKIITLGTSVYSSVNSALVFKTLSSPEVFLAMLFAFGDGRALLGGALSPSISRRVGPCSGPDLEPAPQSH